MAVASTEYKHIQLDDQGTAIIAGSTMKVVELVTSHLADGWDAGELHAQYPHLSLGQIYSALAYYWDHKTTIDAEIERQFEFAEALRKQASPSPIREKLRAKGLLV
ncbi:DUF433 domain-containing protein [Synechococcales cyanobacterium C]|uniref:DUF433 domain-containing protein n=1 Tax=Petrachloros mirabilis ULC683 TaxID=2781853 RepID=A0A8K1ZZK4_9CYAN|nr:DUF433 domain-containing protein [Petrachloros mirabilis]NCJ06878.1 DUF433 domain-containing protein [Petrachloros mirabilis ULC683]